MAYNPTDYPRKLLDGRWQRKRLEVLERDKFTCRTCGTTNDLHVHHNWYLKGLDPWQYNVEQLITLCANCHKSASSVQDDLKKALSFACPKLQEQLLATLCDLKIGNKENKDGLASEDASWHTDEWQYLGNNEWEQSKEWLNWRQVLESPRISGMLKEIAGRAYLVEATAENRWQITFPSGSQKSLDYTDSRRSDLEGELFRLTGARVLLSFVMDQ